VALVESSFEDLSAMVRSFIDGSPWLPLSGVTPVGARPTERIVFADGLSEEELGRIESNFRFAFPPDLRVMLSVALPISKGFPDWRSAEAEDLETMLDWPADGICFDISHNAFWFDGWGDRPLDTDTACSNAREHIADAPVLIPVYRHRYIPAQPSVAGNPVFSVWQSDITYYGRDLTDYLNREFCASDHRAPVTGTRRVPFWSDLIA